MSKNGRSSGSYQVSERIYLGEILREIPPSGVLTRKPIWLGQSRIGSRYTCCTQFKAVLPFAVALTTVHNGSQHFGVSDALVQLKQRLRAFCTVVNVIS